MDIEAVIAEATDDQLAAMVSEYAADDAVLTAVLDEIERRDRCARADEAAAQEQAQRVAMVADERRAGESLEQTVDRMYGEFTYTRYLAAEDATRGHMLNAKGQAAGIDPYELFHGPAKRAAAYASPELARWFKEHGRISWIEYKAQMLGRAGDVRKAAQARRNAADYGF